jgi:hydrogenase maturation protease
MGLEGAIVRKVLIVGYGNSMRGDDVAGCRVAKMLQDHYHADPEVRVIGAHQLTPEMAEDISGSEFVLFLDAAVGAQTGEIKHAQVIPHPGPLSFAHSLAPDVLLSAALELYGSVPPAELLTIAGDSFELSTRMSNVVRARLPALFEKARVIVDSRRQSSPARALR